MTPIQKLRCLAEIVSDGHYTIMKFTTNYRVSLYTPECRDDIQKMAEGNTLDEAVNNLIKKIEKGSLNENSKHRKP